MSKAPTIAPELADLPHVPVSALVPLQGDLKQLSEREYNKLRKSLTENGVIVPFFVWLETGKLLDGHQRQRVFLREGWECDVPVVYISADDEADAKRKLLVISSQYGKVTQEGWDEFTFDLDGDWLAETVHFDALPFVFEDWGDDEEPESEDAEPQVSRADELREQWGVDLGQMWRLPSRTEGQEHRLICGDSGQYWENSVDTLFFDPEWDDMPPPPRVQVRNCIHRWLPNWRCCKTIWPTNLAVYMGLRFKLVHA